MVIVSAEFGGKQNHEIWSETFAQSKKLSNYKYPHIHVWTRVKPSQTKLLDKANTTSGKL